MQNVDSRVMALRDMRDKLAASDLEGERIIAEYLDAMTGARVSEQGVTLEREDGKGLFVPQLHIEILQRYYL